MKTNDTAAATAIVMTLGRSTLLVRNQDEALAFYRDQLGFEVLYDGTNADGFRALHIGLPGQRQEPRVGLWLIRARSSEEQALVGRQAGGEPILVIYTNDCRRAGAMLAGRGVKFRIPPKADPGAVVAHFEDLYGNELVLVELLRD